MTILEALQEPTFAVLCAGILILLVFFGGIVGLIRADKNQKDNDKRGE